MPIADEEFKERCEQFYAQFAPEKKDSAETIEKIVKTIASGKKTQLQMFESLIGKYSVTDEEKERWLAGLGDDTGAPSAQATEQRSMNEVAAPDDSPDYDVTLWGPVFTAFYQKYQPDKVSIVEQLKTKLAPGKKSGPDLIEMLCKKYNVGAEEKESWLKRASESSADTVSKRLRRFLAEYDKEAFRDPDALLVLYEGNEEEMFRELVKFYGPEPKLTDPRPRLVRFIEHYAPSKRSIVESLLTEWEGREDQLFHDLCANYGPEPPIPRMIPAPSPSRTNNASRTRHEVLENFFSFLSTDGLSAGNKPGVSAPDPQSPPHSRNVPRFLGPSKLGQGEAEPDMRFSVRKVASTTTESVPLWKMDDFTIRFGDAPAVPARDFHPKVTSPKMQSVSSKVNVFTTPQRTPAPVTLSPAPPTEPPLYLTRGSNDTHPMVLTDTSAELSLHRLPINPSVQLIEQREPALIIPSHPATFLPHSSLERTRSRVFITSPDKRQAFLWRYSSDSAATSRNVTGWNHIHFEGAPGEALHEPTRYPPVDSCVTPFVAARAEYLVTVVAHNLASSRRESVGNLRPCEELLGSSETQDECLMELFWVQMVDENGRDMSVYHWQRSFVSTGAVDPFVSAGRTPPQFIRMTDEERSCVKMSCQWQQFISETQLYLQLWHPSYRKTVHGILDVSPVLSMVPSVSQKEYRSVFFRTSPVSEQNGPPFKFSFLKTEVMTPFQEKRFISVFPITGLVLELCSGPSGDTLLHGWLHLWQPAAKNFHPTQRIDFPSASLGAEPTGGKCACVLPIVSSDCARIYLLGVGAGPSSAVGKLLGTLTTAPTSTSPMTSQFLYVPNVSDEAKTRYVASVGSTHYGSRDRRSEGHCTDARYNSVSTGFRWDQVQTILPLLKAEDTRGLSFSSTNAVTSALVLGTDLSSYTVIQLGLWEKLKSYTV